jgi:hypothetical protein
MLSRLQIAVLKLVSQDLVFSDKTGGSTAYSRHGPIVHELAAQKYCYAVKSGACRLDYLLTSAGEAVLKGQKV